MDKDIEDKVKKIEAKVDKKNKLVLDEISKLRKDIKNKEIDRKKRIGDIFSIVSYVFLFLLLVIALNQFFKWEFVTGQMTRLIVLAIVFGSLTFWYNRNKINFDLDKEKSKEEIKEGKRKREFSSKFPKINQIPILKNIFKWMYKEGLYAWALIGIYIIFAIIQIYKIYTTGIGTDEGNFLYTIKLIFQGNMAFLDLWIRESGSLLFLIPWFKIFEVNIINLRWLIFLIHTIIFILFYSFLKCISKRKKTNLIILLISVILLQFNANLDIFQGIFYQLNSLFSILILYLSYKYYSSKSNYLAISLIGILTGLAILSYKGLQTFLVIVPFIILLKNREIGKKYIRQILIFFISAFIPLLIYWFYYSLRTDFFHIYKVIMEDVIINFGILFLIFLVISIILLKKQIKGLLQKNSLIIITNIIVLFAIIYELIIEPGKFFFSFYSGVFLSYPFLIILLQLLNLYVLDIYRKVVSLSYALFNILVLIFGFGSRGFFTKVPDSYHLMILFFISIYTIYLIYYGFSLNKNQTFIKDKRWFLILIFNIWFGMAIIGGYLMPTRFQTILIFLPIMLILTSSIKLKSKYIIYFLLFLSIIFSIYINFNLPNDYSFYNYNEFSEATNYIKNNFSDELVFSLDTAILTSINNNNLILFHSPFHLRDEEDIYFYDGLKSRYNAYDISLTKSDILEKLKNENPKIIFGAWRSTLRIFDDPEWKDFLDKNYGLIKNFGRIRIYEINS